MGYYSVYNSKHGSNKATIGQPTELGQRKLKCTQLLTTKQGISSSTLKQSNKRKKLSQSMKRRIKKTAHTQPIFMRLKKKRRI